MAHAATREYAMELIEKMAPEKISVAVELLEKMVDPVAWAQANAPFEDEEISAEEEQAVSESREWLKHNRPIPMAEVLADFGLTMEDFERMGQEPRPASESSHQAWGNGLSLRAQRGPSYGLSSKRPLCGFLR